MKPFYTKKQSSLLKGGGSDSTSQDNINATGLLVDNYLQRYNEQSKNLLKYDSTKTQNILLAFIVCATMGFFYMMSINKKKN